MNIQAILDSKGSAAVFTIPAVSTLADFVKHACEKNIGAMIVADEQGRLAGIVTERDALHHYNDGKSFENTKVGDIMTRNVVTVAPEDDINRAMDLMIGQNIRHLPVVGKGKIEGLITVRDLIHAMRESDKEEARALVEYLQNSIKKRQGNT
jgi:CBS domain-containing protein